jgi:hypothetical protein
MSKELQKMLQELKNRGNTELGEEVAAFLEATEKENPCTALPYARKMLAQAAKTLREGTTREDVSIAHDFLGASVEVFREEKAGEEPTIPDAVTATLGRELASEHAFNRVEQTKIEGDSPDFNNAPEELVTVLANLLLDGGYVDEARKYLTEYNVKNEERNTIVATKTKKTLKELQAQYRKNGDLVRARALEEVISDLDEDLDDEEAPAKVGDALPEVEDDACKAGEDECEDEAKGEEKPVLQVEPASDEECKEKEEAQAALAKGNIKSAKKHLTNAANMERMRLTAALIRIGDMELAMAGLVEAEGEEDEVPADEKCGGFNKPTEEVVEDDESDAAEECDVEHEADEKPSEAEMAKRADDAADDDEADEKEVAQAIARHVRKSVKAGNMKAAKEGLRDLSKLEQAIVAGVKKAEEQIKDMALAKEGYKLWKEVRAMNLKAIRVVAEEEGDEEKVEKTTEGLDALTDDAAPKAEDAPPVSEDEMLEENDGDLADSLDSTPEEDTEEQPEEDKEADAMKYECLQSLDALKNMNVDRNALAFTFWESKEDPFWTIQASGKPIAEVHLADQTDPEDVAAFFCDQARWPNVIAQTTEKVGLYSMLKGVKARFYAHGVTKSALAKTLKTEVEASLKDLRTERLGTLRNDFVDAMVCAADSLNKGLMTGKSNPLKRAFVDKLASLGFSNPALVVEECFASSFRPYLDQVIADAGEYLEMPKEAFAHTKRMISAANNVAVAQASQFSDESLVERLSRRSMPLAHSEEAYDAPAEIEASLRNMSATEKQNNMKKRLRLGLK